MFFCFFSHNMCDNEAVPDWVFGCFWDNFFASGDSFLCKEFGCWVPSFKEWSRWNMAHLDPFTSMIYPLVMTFTVRHGFSMAHRKFDGLPNVKMCVIFHGYVKKPEGTSNFGDVPVCKSLDKTRGYYSHIVPKHGKPMLSGEWKDGKKHGPGTCAFHGVRGVWWWWLLSPLSHFPEWFQGNPREGWHSIFDPSRSDLKAAASLELQMKLSLMELRCTKWI